MKSRSLRLRLAIAAATSIALAMLIAGFALTAIFARHVNRRVEAELDAHLREFAAGVSFAEDGTLQPGRPPSDPRFVQPFSGHYWQIEDDVTGRVLRSRSLWDYTIELPRSGTDGSVHRYMLPGPQGSSLLVLERHIAYPTGDRQHEVRISVAIDRQQVIEATRDFAGDMTLSLGLLALLLLLAATTQITVGLQPLEALRRAVKAVRSGRSSSIDVTGPAEVMPLVSEVNSLLRSQAVAVDRAMARAADLAHGLKTPLTVLAGDATRLRAKGEAEIAAELEDLAAGMRLHIERQLMRVRLDASARTRPAAIALRPVVEAVVRTLSRSPKGSQVRWTLALPDGAAAAMREADLAELVGNRLENAMKWARGEVLVTARQGPLSLTIEDDGPGVARAELERLGRRGVRLDEGVEGSGLGLAICQEIVDAYGATLSFGNREPHGFRVEVMQAADRFTAP